VRDYWIYVPAQYKPEKPACTMVFQDGSTFVNEGGAFKTTIVFDNLIHKGRDAGHHRRICQPRSGSRRRPEHAVAIQPQRRIRCGGSAFPHFFLIEEILPEVAKHYNLSNDPNDRAIAGSSSGGNQSGSTFGPASMR